MGDGESGLFSSGLTRRQALVWGGRVAVFAAGATTLAGCTDDGGGDRGGGATDEEPAPAREVTVRLPDYPFVAGTAIRPAPKLLDSLATEYATSQGEGPLDIVQFLYVGVPATAIDSALAESANDIPPGQLLWLSYVSGYFAGLWLRGQIAAAQPGSLLTTFSAPLDDAGFTQLAARAGSGVDAAAGAAAAVLAYNEMSLFDTPNPADPELPYRGLVDTFGYNQGALMQILEVPPFGVRDPDQTTGCSGTLSCTYEAPVVTALERFAPAQEKLNDPRRPAYRRLAQQIEPVQELAISRGRRAWGGEPGLSVEGFSKATYDQTIDVSTSSLEQAQAGALATVQAVAEKTVGVGRQAALAAAVIDAGLGGNRAGLRDGRPDREQPRFVER